MRRPATRLLHVLFSVPVVIALVITASPTVHAQAVPAPLVIVIDPGHGGGTNPAQPDMPLDPGAVAASGLQEKDATLAVSKRLQSLLQQDDVTAILTRSDDRALSIQARSDTANNDRAILYVSVHFNSFTDTSVGGSLVLYPKDADLRFAQVMSDAMDTYLGRLGVANDGVVLRDNWWIHTQMPTVTVEPAYLSNTREAAMIGDPGFEQLLAMSIRSGIESYDPRVLQRKAQIVAWNSAHPDHPVTPAAATVAAHPPAPASSGWMGTLVRDALLAALLAAVIRWPRTAWSILVAVAGLLQRLTQTLLIRRAATRRRRRAVARRALAMHAQRYARPHHIYDELF